MGLRKKLYEKAQYRDSPMGIMLIFLYQIFRNSYIKSIFPTIETIVISLYLMYNPMGEESTILDYFFSSQLYKLLLFFLLIQFLIWLADSFENNRSNYSRSKYLVDHLDKFSGDDLAKYLKILSEKNIDLDKLKTLYNHDFGYQERCKDFCIAVYNFLKKCFGMQNHEIHIFVRQHDGNLEIAKMIAYATMKREPNCYFKKFDLDECPEKQYHIQKGFNLKKNSPIVYTNIKEIKKNFTYDSNKSEKNEKICQYIGIPIFSTLGKDVEMYIQVILKKNNILGKTKSDVEEFIDENLQPFVNLLIANTVETNFYDHAMNIAGGMDV